MTFSFTVGTFLLIILGTIFICVIRSLCRKDVIQGDIRRIDKFMLISLFIHVIWAFLVGVLSNKGYYYLVWDDENYHNFAMRSINEASLYSTNLYNYFLRFLYDLFGRTTLTGRLTNFFFSIATIYPLANVEKRLNAKTEYTGTKFYAYSLFMAFISFFEIKDIIVMFLFVSSYALVKRISEKRNMWHLLLLFSICLLSEQFRSGTGVLPIAILVLSNIHAFGTTRLQRRFFLLFSVAILVVVGVYIGQDYLAEGTIRIERYQRWIFTQFSSESIYNWFVITEITDIWKAPFCAVLYVMQPLDMLAGNMRYFSEFGMLAKAFDVPVLLFSVFTLPLYVRKEKWNSLFFVTLFLFISCINLTNARQGFFLYPLMYLIWYDGYLTIKRFGDDKTGRKRGIYRNYKSWKCCLIGFYIIWLAFVAYRLVF